MATGGSDPEALIKSEAMLYQFPYSGYGILSVHQPMVAGKPIHFLKNGNMRRAHLY
jgi:hypothetical protein